MKELEKVLKALANYRRLAIVKHLKENPGSSVGEIAKAIRLSFKATSKHLGKLSAANILDRDQKGLSMFYRISSDVKSAIKGIFSLL